MAGPFIEEHALSAPALPGALADVLHVLEPTPDGGWDWLFWTLGMLLLLGFVAWFHRRRAVIAEPPPSPRPPASPPTTPTSELAATIDRLRSEVLISGHFRQGCHRLAALLRRRGELVESQPMTRWTSHEIAEFLGDVPMSRVIDVVAELQFARQEPQQGDFEGACELAQDAGAGSRW